MSEVSIVSISATVRIRWISSSCIAIRRIDRLLTVADAKSWKKSHMLLLIAFLLITATKIELLGTIMFHVNYILFLCLEAD